MSLWLLIPTLVVGWGVVSFGLAALLGRGFGAATSRWPGGSPDTASAPAPNVVSVAVIASPSQPRPASPETVTSLSV